MNNNGGSIFCNINNLFIFQVEKQKQLIASTFGPMIMMMVFGTMIFEIVLFYQAFTDNKLKLRSIIYLFLMMWDIFILYSTGQEFTNKVQF